MGQQISRQVLITIPVLLLVTAMVFLLVHIAPGDPVTALAGDQAADPAVIEQLRRTYGLDQPIVVQYARWLGRVLTGDFGYSFTSRQPVSTAITERLTVTLQLTIIAITFALLVALPLGILAAVFRGSIFDYLNQLLAMIGGSMPAFWLGILLILLFAQHWRLLPASGYVRLTEDPVGAVRHLILPAITLGSGFAAVLCRVARASMLDVLHEDYVRTARAKGLADRVVYTRHALRSALLPIITMVGIEAGHLLGGAVVTETVFALPGMGRLLIDGVSSRDFPIVQGATLVLVLLLVASNLLADIAYGVADPRVRRS